MNDALPAHDLLHPVLCALAEEARTSAERLARLPGTRARPTPTLVDPEAVHDFRVALRRLRTMLRPARPLYGKKRLRQSEDELRLYADASGALRDEEVLEQTLAGLTLVNARRAELDAWLARRARQQRARRHALSRLLGGALPVATRGGPTIPPISDVLDRLERKLVPKRESTDALALAARALLDALEGVHAARRPHMGDVRGLHLLRIRFKRLRYTSELFEPILGERARIIAKAAEKMQKRLGTLHDLDTARVRIRRARGLSKAARRAVDAALVAQRRALAQRTKAELHDELAIIAGAAG